MHWKFFELPKFLEHDVYTSGISLESEEKHQWLEFLVDCSKQSMIPERSAMIKKGYEIMKTLNWKYDQKVLYWKQERNEKDALEAQEKMIEDAKAEAREQGLKEGFDKGVAKEQIKGEIKQFKLLKKLEKSGLDITEDQYKGVLKTQTIKYEDIKEHFDTYPDDANMSDNESQLIADMEIDYQ